MKLLVLFLSLLLSAHLTATEIIYKEITSKGYGNTREDAISDAINNGLAQVYGLKIDKSEVVNIQMSIDANILDADLEGDIEANIKTNKRTILNHKYIKSFKITSLEKKDNSFVIEVALELPIISDALDAKRVILFPLKFKNESDKSRVNFNEWLIYLENLITTSKEFSLIDNKFEADVDSELSKYQNDKYSQKDIIKLGHKRGADLAIAIEVLGISEVKTNFKNQNNQFDNFKKAKILFKQIDLVSGDIINSAFIQTPNQILDLMLGKKIIPEKTNNPSNGDQSNERNFVEEVEAEF
jgi:hypothetical protein